MVASIAITENIQPIFSLGEGKDLQQQPQPHTLSVAGQNILVGHAPPDVGRWIVGTGAGVLTSSVVVMAVRQRK